MEGTLWKDNWGIERRKDRVELEEWSIGWAVGNGCKEVWTVGEGIGEDNG